MNPAIERLLERRLLVVAGKGGVGKTTIACALGLIAAQHGKRTLLAEVDGAGRAARLLGSEPAPVGQAREVRPALAVMAVDGRAALAEYLEIIVPVKRVLHAVFSSRIYQYFVAAAPGLKELMTIGKIWYEAERVDETSGRHLWDIVILDAPATGHSLQYLRMPHAALDAFKGGLVGRESRRLVQLLTDARRTAINLVTTGEEMPVNETLEMYAQVREQLHMPLGCLFVNRVHAGSFAAADLDRLEGRLAGLRERRARTLAAAALQRAREESGWTAINRSYIERLAGAIEAPLLQVPFVFTEEFGVEQVRAIARLLAGEDAAAARPRMRTDAAR